MTRAPRLHPWHCSGLIADGALRTPCSEAATLFYVNEDGRKIGYCADLHSFQGHQEATLRRWVRVEQRLAAA